MMSNLLNYFLEKSKTSLDVEIVKYGYKLLISSVIGTVIVLFLALLINKIKDAIIFLISFSFIRRYSGGYHCSAYLHCNLLLVITFLGSMIWLKVKMGIVEYILVLISLVYILLYAPIKNRNKLLNDMQLLRIRKRIEYIVIIYFYMMILCWVESVKSVMGYSIVLTALLMIGGEHYY